MVVVVCAAIAGAPAPTCWDPVVPPAAFLLAPGVHPVICTGLFGWDAAPAGSTLLPCGGPPSTGVLLAHPISKRYCMLNCFNISTR